MKMTAEEVKALPALPEVDHTGLVRVQLQTKLTEQGRSPVSGLFGLLPR